MRANHAMPCHAMPEGNDQITCTHFTFLPLSSPREQMGPNDCDKKGTNTLRLNSQTLKKYFIKSKVYQKGVRQTSIVFEDVWYRPLQTCLRKKKKTFQVFSLISAVVEEVSCKTHRTLHLLSPNTLSISFNLMSRGGARRGRVCFQ